MFYRTSAESTVTPTIAPRTPAASSALRYALICSSPAPIRPYRSPSSRQTRATSRSGPERSYGWSPSTSPGTLQDGRDIVVATRERDLGEDQMRGRPRRRCPAGRSARRGRTRPGRPRLPRRRSRAGRRRARRDSWRARGRARGTRRRPCSRRSRTRGPRRATRRRWRRSSRAQSIAIRASRTAIRAGRPVAIASSARRTASAESSPSAAVMLACQRAWTSAVRSSCGRDAVDRQDVPDVGHGREFGLRAASLSTREAARSTAISPWARPSRLTCASA